jgi:hypothetical protein
MPTRYTFMSFFWKRVPVKLKSAYDACHSGSIRELKKNNNNGKHIEVFERSSSRVSK